MQRKKLLALEINKNRADVPAMQAVVELQHKGKYVNYTTHQYNYVYDAFIDESTGEKTLIVDMFKPAPAAEFLYRLFIGKNKQGDDKWFIVKSDGTVSESSLPVDYYCNQFYYQFSADTDKVIDEYLSDTKSYAKGKGIKKIIAWQKAVREKRLKDKYQKIKDSISYELAEIRPLPQSVHKWIDNTVMAYSRYMFYDANGKKQTTANAMISLCENLKLMRDKHLYEALGFETFDTYTEQACGIKRRQAYNYISTYEKLGGTVLQSNAQLGITKLQLLTEVCAVDRAEIIAENDLAGMSVKEIKELVEKSKQQGEQLALLGDELNDSNNAQKSLQADKQNLAEENKLLHKRIKELESKPVEVAVQEPTQAQIEAAAKSKINSLKASFEKEKQNAVEEAVKQATEKTKSSVKETLEKDYKAKLESIEKERQAALDKAKQLANRLDKNADAELVTATLYFNELQAQLDKFINSVEKICETNSAQGEKLKQIAQNFLSNTIANLN